MLTGLVEKGRSKCELYFPLGKKGPANKKSYHTVTTTKIRDRFTFDSRSTTQHYEEVETIDFEELDSVHHGKYQVRYVGEENLGECNIRCLELQRSDERKSDNRTVYHYWYPNWQDHKMANPEQVLKIALHVLELTSKRNPDKSDNKHNDDRLSMTTDGTKRFSDRGKKNSSTNNNNNNNNNLRNGGLPKTGKQKTVEKKKSPERRSVSLVAHCSAGIGRTGCFLAILNGIQQLRSNYNVDVLAILCSLRLHRGGMVQNAEQYELIHRVLNLYVDLM